MLNSLVLHIMKKGNKAYYSENISIQLDSLNRLDPKGEYILIHDEVNSLFSHFLNTIEKMSNNRVSFIEKIFSINLECRASDRMQIYLHMSFDLSKEICKRESNPYQLYSILIEMI
eukprot:TRINITY_DN2110_c0_g2_i1.p1 TRINITY_DN2110_c0_g2~~TRINITY_DN2110_c0_g2_i1.p1  ORF type:complete len:116 (-),score=5.97 TRINITY_DN2110_c0_g2_i1:835-1182(-)